MNSPDRTPSEFLKDASQFRNFCKIGTDSLWCFRLLVKPRVPSWVWCSDRSEEFTMVHNLNILMLRIIGSLGSPKKKGRRRKAESPLMFDVWDCWILLRAIKFSCRDFCCMKVLEFESDPRFSYPISLTSESTVMIYQSYFVWAFNVNNP